MICLDCFVTVENGYKKVSELVVNDILYDPIDKYKLTVTGFGERIFKPTYMLVINRLHPLYFSPDTWFVGEQGLIKASDVCPRIPIKTVLGFVRPSFVRPIQPIQMMSVDYQPPDKPIIVNGIYILFRGF